MRLLAIGAAVQRTKNEIPQSMVHRRNRLKLPHPLYQSGL